MSSYDHVIVANETDIPHIILRAKRASASGAQAYAGEPSVRLEKRKAHPAHRRVGILCSGDAGSRTRVRMV